MHDNNTTQHDRLSTIVLLGYMYTGKTTMGKSLAKRLNYDFFDTDNEIENAYHYTVIDIFRHFSEQVFRNMERQILMSLLKRDHVVIACGGGAPCFFDNIKQINDNAISVYLKMDSKHIISRYQKSKSYRPLLMNKTDDEVKDYINQSLQERQQYYNKADIIIDAFDLTPQKLEQVIQDFLAQNKSNQ